MLTFQPFTLQEKSLVDSYVKPYGFDCSEFTFTNMIIWGQDGKIQWAEEENVLYVRLQFGIHPPFMFPPIPRDRDMPYAKAVDNAVRYFHEIGSEPRFRSVSGRFAELFRMECPQFTLIPDRNTFDYIYLAEDLINLSGRKFHAKRNHVNQFTSQYSFEYRPLTAAQADECMELYLSWLQEKDIHEPGILGEMKAIRFLLPNMDALGVMGGSIYIADKLVAFTIGEMVSEKTAVVHIEKADASYMGLYAVINQQFATHALSKATYINREEDMGIPGMRKAKLSYRPVRLIEKYDVILRP